MSESLFKRYFFKLIANGVGFVGAAITTFIVPRALGPHEYGSFSFLSSFFQNIVNFFDSGTSNYYFSTISKKPQEKGLIGVYGGFALICGLVLLFCTAGVWFGGWGQWIWPDQGILFIAMGAGWGLLTWYAKIIQQTVDAYGLTVEGEKRQIQQRCLGLGLILFVNWCGWLNLTVFFSYHYFLLAFVMICWWKILRRNGIYFSRVARLTSRQIKFHGNECYSYSAPLITLALVGMAGAVLDRWLLQQFGGSVEQGLFGFAFQIASTSFLFTGAMAPLLLREFSLFYGKSDIESMRRLFLRYIPALYFVAAFLAGFMTMQAEKICFIVGGKQYLAATTALSILAFFPMHGVYGQLSGSVFLSTGNTRVYRNIGIGVTAIGMLLALWLLAPERWGGLDMKSTGLAVKMVVCNAVIVNLQLWFNARLLDFPFRRLLEHQLYSVGVLVFVAWLVSASIDYIIPNIYVSFFASGLLYLTICLGAVFLWPSFIGSSRRELVLILKRIIGDNFPGLLRRIKS